MNIEHNTATDQEGFSWRKLPLETRYKVAVGSLRQEIGAFRSLVFQLLGPEEGGETLTRFYAGMAAPAYLRAKEKHILKGDSLKDVVTFLCTFYETEGIPVHLNVTDDAIRIQFNYEKSTLCPWGLPEGDPRLCCGTAWAKEMVKLINPKLRLHLSKSRRWGDDCCEEVIQWDKG